MVVKIFPSLLLLVCGALLPAESRTPAADASGAPRSEEGFQRWFKLPQATNNNQSFLFTNALPNALEPGPSDLTNSLSVLTNRFTQGTDRTLPAGVYKTEPFSMIVVSPGTHPDDRSIRPFRPQNSSIPQYAPDLRFKKWSPAKR